MNQKPALMSALFFMIPRLRKAGITMTVEEMKAVDIRTVCPEELVDITKLSIDKSLEGDDRNCCSRACRPLQHRHLPLITLSRWLPDIL